MAVGGLGGLLISLGLDTADFTRSLTKSEHDFNRMVQNIERQAAAMGRAVAAAAVVAGTAAVVMGSRFIEAAADLDDLAEKTGASVEELSKLEQQARISGGSMETLEMGMVRLSKALHDGDEEAQGAGKALAQLGLKAADLRNMDTAQALRVVAGELDKYADGSGKTALALALFGKSGAQLLPILKDMAAEGKLNASVTAEQAAAAEELGKSWRRLTNDATVFGQSIALDMVPSIQNLITQLRIAKEVGEGAWDSIKLFMGNSGANPLAEINQTRKELEEAKAARARLMQPTMLNRVREALGSDGLSDVNTIIATLEKRLKFLTGVAVSTSTDRDNFDANLMAQKPKINFGAGTPKSGADTARKLEEVKRLYEEVAAIGHSIDVTVIPPAFKDLDKDKRELTDLKKQLEEGRKGWIAYAEAVFDTADAEQTAAAQGKSFTQTAIETRDRLLDLIDPLRAVRREHEFIDLLVDQGWMTKMQGDLAKLPAEVRALLQPLSNIHNEIQRAWEAGLLSDEQMVQALDRVRDHNLTATDDITEFWRRAAESMQQSMSDLFFDVMQGDLDNFGKNTLRMLDRIVSEILAAKAATALFGSDFGKGGSGKVGGLVGQGLDWLTRQFGGGSTPWSDGAGSAVVADAAGNLIPALDKGTPFVERDGIAYLHRGERVMTARQNREFATQGDRAVYINVNTPDADSFRRTKQQLAAELGAAFGAMG